MRAVVYSAPGEVTVTDVPEPTLRADTDALVKVELTGICGTDLHAISGQMPGVTPGTVLGHEFVGTVVETGTAVRRLRVGDTVMTSDFTACGDCWWCARGDHWHCPRRQFFGTGTAFGPALTGAQAEFVRVPFADTTMTGLPDGIDAEAALLIGDNLATGWVAMQRAGVRPGDVVAIIGGGPVGQLASLAAQVHGAAVVVLSDPMAQRRDLASAQGAVTTEPAGLRRIVDSLTAGRGADAVVEAVGGAVGLDAALATVRPGGTVVSVSAHTQESWAFPLARSFAREVTVRFAIGDSIRVRPELTSVVGSGVLDPTVVISGHHRLRDAAAGYRELSTLKEYKVVLDPLESR
jgi:2-desacetyl-2-hydroxyethyl bacteriochlorophyllide A dehydrogenase